MSKLIVWVLFITFSFSVNASNIVIQPKDCSLLKKGEYGAVFYTHDGNTVRSTYFIKGDPNYICGNIYTHKFVTGYELDLPKSDLFTTSEQELVKEFVIVSYGN